MNPGLALAISKAKAANVPNANIDKAIKRGTGELGGAVIEEMTYEGYGPSGIAVIVECASDNRNRTYSDVRTAFAKNGGNIAETGSVAFQFERKGVIQIAKTGDDEADELTAIDSGAEDILDDDDQWTIYTDAKQLNEVKKSLEAEGLEVKETSLSFVPKTKVSIAEESTQTKVMKLMDALDELDDVVETHTNFEIA